jgi:putative SOS response-associated peptidase YedK
VCPPLGCQSINHRHTTTREELKYRPWHQQKSQYHGAFVCWEPKHDRLHSHFENEGEPLAFAGLWDAWKEPKPKVSSLHTPDTWLQSYSIITTEANEIMSTIQLVNSMPVLRRPVETASVFGNFD